MARASAKRSLQEHTQICVPNVFLMFSKGRRQPSITTLRNLQLLSLVRLIVLEGWRLPLGTH